MSYQCFECSARADHAHHIVPRSRGGTRTIPLCVRCHGLAHSRSDFATGSLIREGLERKKAQGFKLGRPVTLDRAAILTRVLAGDSYSKISRDFGCSKAGVSKVVKAYRKACEVSA